MFFFDLFTGENSSDQEKLLQTIHDEKTTLSRAIGQNKTLKEQLVELQDKIIAMVKRTNRSENF